MRMRPAVRSRSRTRSSPGAACSSTLAPGWGMSTRPVGPPPTRRRSPGIPQSRSGPCASACAPAAGRCAAWRRLAPTRTARCSSPRRPRATARRICARAYNLPTSGGNGRIVAIVDAYDDPTAESDLADVPRRSTACRLHDGERLLQEGRPDRLDDAAARGRHGLGRRDLARPRHGQRRLPRLQDPARRGQLSDGRRPRRGASTRRRALGAVAISNSYGGGEDSTRHRPSSSEYYNHPGVLVTASSGDQRLRRRVPRDVAVRRRRRRHVARQVHARARLEPRRAWTRRRQRLQRVHPEAELADATRAAASALEADVSAVADPNTGVAVYSRGAVAGRLRRHERRVAARRGDLHAARPRRAGAVVRVDAHVGLLRRDLGQQRQLQPGVPLHRGRRLRRPDGLGHAERRGARGRLEQQLSSSSSSGRARSSSSSGSSGVEQRLEQQLGGSSSSSSSGQRLQQQRAPAARAAAAPAASSAQLGPASAAAAAERARTPCARRARTLTTTCSTCAGDVCAQDPYCCQRAVGQHLRQRGPAGLPGLHVGAGGGGGGGCAHNVCKSGAKPSPRRAARAPTTSAPRTRIAARRRGTRSA